jgi:hypothetical protein
MNTQKTRDFNKLKKTQIIKLKIHHHKKPISTTPFYLPNHPRTNNNATTLETIVKKISFQL